MARPEEIAKDFEQLLNVLRQGATLKAALARVGWPRKKWDYHSQKPGWKPRYYEALSDGRAAKNLLQETSAADMSFDDFLRVVLKREIFAHQRQWIEWVSDVEATHILIVTAPDTAKSTTFRNFITYSICKDPLIRCAYATFAHDKAVKQIQTVRRILEDNVLLREAFGNFRPEDSRPWANQQFMVAQRSWDAGQDEADFSLAGFGNETQVAGSRIDLFIIDDADGKRNLSSEERRKIYERVMVEYEGRRNPIGGKLVVICNRWSDDDLAALIMKQNEENPGLWKVYTQVAELRAPGPEKDDWGEYIWPERFGLPNTADPHASVRKDGDWSMRNAYYFFKKKRALLGEKLYGLLYMNDVQAGSERTFPDEVVQRAIDRGRSYKWGQVPAGGLVVAFQDPASVEGAATGALAVVPEGLLLVDIHWDTKLGTTGLLEQLERFGAYGPAWWAIEGQGPFKTYAEGPEVLRIVRAQMARLEVMKTGENRHTQDVGIDSLRPVVANDLIIPSQRPEDLERMAPLIDQLKRYRPPEYEGAPGHGGRYINRSGANDCVLGLWQGVRLIRERKLVPRVEKKGDVMGWRSPYVGAWEGGAWSLARR